jgi:hypothetical protein
VSHFASFTMATLCPLGPRDCMNCSETERSNQTWVHLWASPRSLPESTYLSSGHTSSMCFHLVLVGRAACLLWSDFIWGKPSDEG